MKCPKCSSEQTSKQGTRRVKRSKNKIIKWYCEKCFSQFIDSKRLDYGRRIPAKTIRKILDLADTHLSQNEIARETGVVPSTVRIIKKDFYRDKFGYHKNKGDEIERTNA